MVDRLLVIYRKQLGDLLLLQPALTFLAERHGWPVAVAGRPGTAELLSLMPGRIGSVEPLATLAGARRLYCFQTADTWRAALVPAGEKILCLTRSTAAGFVQRRVFDQISVEAAADSYRALVNFRLVGGAAADFAPPRLHAPPAAWLPAGLPERYVLLHPTSAWREKSWSASHWAEVLRHLGQAWPVVLTSGRSDWEQALCREIVAAAPDRVLDLGGKTSLREYFAIVHRASAVLCVDGSASHLAAAFGRPALTLFGPTNPVHWHWPTPAQRALSAEQFAPGVRKPAVDGIPVAAVLAELEHLALA